MHRLRLEIAADYLVMAAWLAYLKSRLLLPDPPAVDDEPSAEELAAALHRRLQLLSAMQRAGAALMAGTLLGRDVFARGTPEEFAPVDRPVYELSLYDLLSAYGTTHRRQHAQVLTILPAEMYSLEDGLRHLNQFIGKVPEWQDLMAFLPEELRDGMFRRSAVAATFSATLELVRSGRIELRQDRPFGPLYLRSAGAGG
jgi:segregation and condensation protein A